MVKASVLQAAIGLVLLVLLTACQSFDRANAQPRGTIIALYSDPSEYLDACSSNVDPNRIVLSCYRFHDLGLAETLAGDTPSEQLSLAIESWNDPPDEEWIIIARWVEPWAAEPELDVLEVYNLPADGTVFCIEPEWATYRALNAVRGEFRDLFNCEESDRRLPSDRFGDPEAFG